MEYKTKSNLQAIKESILEKQAQEEKLITDAKQKLFIAKNELEDLSVKYQETYRSGDLASGEKLFSEQIELKNKVDYLSSFIAQREKTPIYSREETMELVRKVNKCLDDEFYIDMKKVTKSINDFSEISSKYAQLFSETSSIAALLSGIVDNNFSGINVAGSNAHNLYRLIDSFVRNCKRLQSGPKGR